MTVVVLFSFARRSCRRAHPHRARCGAVRCCAVAGDRPIIIMHLNRPSQRSPSPRALANKFVVVVVVVVVVVRALAKFVVVVVVVVVVCALASCCCCSCVG